MAKQKKLGLTSPKELQLAEQTFTAAQLRAIKSPTPKDQIKTRPAKGGGTWKYVTGAHTIEALNTVFGLNWDFEIKDSQYDINIGQAFVRGRLTARTKGTVIVKEQFGRVEIKFKTETRTDEKGQTIMNQYGRPKRFPTTTPLDLGNDLKAAATDAMKKCATLLGFFKDVYQEDDYLEVEIVEDEELENAREAKKYEALVHHLGTAQSEEAYERVWRAYNISVGDNPTEEAIEIYNRLKNNS